MRVLVSHDCEKLRVYIKNAGLSFPHDCALTLHDLIPVYGLFDLGNKKLVNV